MRGSVITLGLIVTLLIGGVGVRGASAETVKFPSADGKTTLVGYLFRPYTDALARQSPHRVPAVVLLHGRSGPYSSLAKGVYTEAALSQRHAMWAALWAREGYAALLVDSFGPRGHPGGFPRGSYAQRPAEVSEQTVRPLDAYGALAYLRTRPDIIGDRVGVQGWSNGAMTALVTISDSAPGIRAPTPETGFRAALALYPGCGMAHVKDRFVPYAPLLMLLASADDEVSPATCEALGARTRAVGAPIEVVTYEGAEHSFDDPGQRRQAVEANRRATDDAKARAVEFFRTHLRP